jgi:DNA-binding GntR family transcriptional regulator
MADLTTRLDEELASAAAIIKRGTPLYEQIYDALWDLIFQGEIGPGQRLGDRDWALRLQTSRTPVREAMRQMARDGVLIVLENGGYQVRGVDPQGLANLYQCRAPLAALAVYHATLAGSDQLFRQIRGVVERTAKAIARQDSDATLKLNSKFHGLVVESSGNPYLILIMAKLEKLILFYRIALLRNTGATRRDRDRYFQHLDRVNDRQLQIVDLMSKGDAEKASRLMQEHLLSSAEDMAQLLHSP